MADIYVDLKLDRTKLNPNFDGFKLSLDNLPLYKLSCDSKPEDVQLADTQYSYQHVKSFGVHNALSPDPWMNNVVYFINQKWKVVKFAVAVENVLEQPKSVLQIPNKTEHQSIPERVAATLSFSSPDLAILANGAGTLYVCKTFDRKEDLMWQVIHTVTPLDENTSFQVLHSVCHTEDHKSKLECLLVHVEAAEESDAKKNKSPFKSVIEWLTYLIVESKDGTTLELERSRKFEGGTAPDYAAIEPNGKGVNISSEKLFTMVYDSVKPVEIVKEEAVSETKKDNVNEECKEEEIFKPMYLWTQSDEDVNLHFILPPETTKADVVFKPTRNHLDVALTSGQTLINGDLCGEIDVEGSTWTVSNLEVNSDVGDFVKPDQLKLQVILSKKDSTKWSSVISGDDRGKLVVDESQIALMIETLSNFQRVLNAESEEAQKPAFNVQELEECDGFSSDQSVLIRIDGETHKVTHQVNLGSHQQLFTCQSDSNKPPCLCLRHDVDGIVWQPTDDVLPKQVPWQHIATFDAFGYVQASKQQRKFTTCAPDFSYAVIADAVRHIYIYRQPAAITSPVRNRKTGQKIDSVAKQQLISLETVEPITGIYAANERMFVVAGDIIHVIKIREENSLL